MRYLLIVILVTTLCAVESCTPAGPTTDTDATYQITTGSLPAGATLDDNGLSLPALPEDKKTPAWVWNKNIRISRNKVIQNMQYIPFIRIWNNSRAHVWRLLGLRIVDNHAILPCTFNKEVCHGCQTT